MRPRWEFARRFAEGIRKLTGNTPGDCQKKIRRLTARMPKAVGLARIKQSSSSKLGKKKGIEEEEKGKRGEEKGLRPSASAQMRRLRRRERRRRNRGEEEKEKNRGG
ncbi:hypothetical protein GW17_00057242, partial [Ensete ventricosum]